MSKPKKIAVITGASSGMGREFARRIEEKYRGELDEIWLIARLRSLPPSWALRRVRCR